MRTVLWIMMIIEAMVFIFNSDKMTKLMMLQLITMDFVVMK